MKMYKKEVKRVLKEDNPDAKFRMVYGHDERIVFLDGFIDFDKYSFIMHDDDLTKIEEILGRKFGGMCFSRGGFSMSFIKPKT